MPVKDVKLRNTGKKERVKGKKGKKYREYCADIDQRTIYYIKYLISEDQSLAGFSLAIEKVKEN